MLKGKTSVQKTRVENLDARNLKVPHKHQTMLARFNRSHHAELAETKCSEKKGNEASQVVDDDASAIRNSED